MIRNEVLRRPPKRHTSQSMNMQLRSSAQLPSGILTHSNANFEMGLTPRTQSQLLGGKQDFRNSRQMLNHPASSVLLGIHATGVEGSNPLLILDDVGFTDYNAHPSLARFRPPIKGAANEMM